MQTDIYDGGTSSFFQTYRWHSNSNKIPFWLWSNTKHLYFRCFFGLRFWVGIYLWVTPQNSDLWPTGFPSALGVRDSLPVNKSAVIRGYKTGAVSFGLENAPGTYYQRLQINPNGTVVYYYLPEGATTLKTATLVHLEDLLWLCWRQQNSDLANAIASKPCNLSGGTVEFIIDISNLQIKRFALHVTCSGSIWAEFMLLIISYSDLSAPALFMQYTVLLP